MKIEFPIAYRTGLEGTESEQFEIGYTLNPNRYRIPMIFFPKFFKGSSLGFCNFFS